MADAKLTALTAASALAAADLFYVSQSAASRKATGTQLLALVGTAYVPLAGGTMTGALAIASGTLTASAPALNITQTWNNAGVSFRAIDINITNTLSALSYPIVVSVNAANVFYVSSAGDLYANNFRTTSNNGSYGIGSDALVYRDAAATLAQRNGTTQQIFRLYNSYTDSSNFERLTLTGVAGSSVNITAETLGTGGDNLDVVITAAGTGGVQFNTSGSVKAYIDSNGNIVGVNYIASNGRIAVGNSYDIKMGSSSDIKWTATNYAGTTDLALRRSAAGVMDIDNGTAATYRDLKLRNLLQTAYQEVTEMTAPSAPATNSVRIYAEDNGSGKTRLMALFATGVAQQIAIEP